MNDIIVMIRFEKLDYEMLIGKHIRSSLDGSGREPFFTVA
jgi:hypothetical protein